jgi:1-acyl-sn-glycerol-3-phosphate acyltransferase
VGDRVLPFRRGLFGVALRAGIDVVPVALRYDPPGLTWVGDATFVPHFLRLAARRRARVTVTFGAPLSARSHEDSAGLAAAAHARVTALLERAPSSTKEGPTPCRKTQP